MELKVTRFEIDSDGIATLWLDRPGRGNSWTGRMHAEIRWICAHLEAEDAVRVIVVRGTGNAFCVGADFKALDSHLERGRYDAGVPLDAAAPGYGVRAEFDADMAWQLGLRVPMIAAVNGGCAGIALALAAFCDLRIAVADAKITAVAPRLGLPAEYGLSWMLPRLIGATHAADLLLTGRVVTADAMRDWGFFNAVVDRSVFDATVAMYAGALAAASPDAVTAAKRQLWGDLLHGDPGEAVEQSKRMIATAMQQGDYREAVSAMAEKRPPRFARGVTRGV
jgi:enoyl-CoA hydratase/carnithine racemase